MSTISQTSPTTMWLDEELRKEKAIVAQLRDVADKQQILLADQAQRTLALEDRLVKLQGQLLRISEVEEALRHTRDELALMLADLRKDQQQREAESASIRRAEREQDVRAVQEIRLELQRFDSLEQAIPAREAEERRLNECVLRLEQSLETIVKRLSLQEEIGRQLADRIEHNALALGQMREPLAQAEEERHASSSRILSLETALPKLQQSVAEVQSMREQLSGQQDELQENQRRGESERSRALTEWRRQMESFAHQMEGWAEQLRYFSDQHEKNRRVLREVEDLARQVSQQQDQLRQVQRIAEERLRHDFREWHSENERRWAQELESRKNAEQAQAKVDGAHDQRLMALAQWRKDDLAQMSVLRERLDALFVQLKGEAGRLREAQFSALQLQIKAHQNVLTEIQELLKNEEAAG
ncbi:MAG TPA: hypothetical protein VMX14_07840 [Anaerolineae bacterium]|nr:hypothetical protein [Anaerolineae bacterium]